MNQTASSLDIHNGPALRDLASSALNETDLLHKMLDELEFKLFPPRPSEGPGPAGRNSDGPPPPLAMALDIVTQRLGSATARLGRIHSAL